MAPTCTNGSCGCAGGHSGASCSVNCASNSKCPDGTGCNQCQACLPHVRGQSLPGAWLRATLQPGAGVRRERRLRLGRVRVGKSVDQHRQPHGRAPDRQWIATGRWVDQHRIPSGSVPAAGWIGTDRRVDQYRQMAGSALAGPWTSAGSRLDQHRQGEDQYRQADGPAPAGERISTDRWLDQHWKAHGRAPDGDWLGTGKPVE